MQRGVMMGTSSAKERSAEAEECVEKLLQKSPNNPTAIVALKYAVFAMQKGAQPDRRGEIVSFLLNAGEEEWVRKYVPGWEELAKHSLGGGEWCL